MNTDPLEALLSTLRSTKPEIRDIPGFDPRNGNLSAKILLVLEAPGPGALAGGVISVDNNDPTARNLKKLLTDSNIRQEEIAIWNVVPWYCGSEDKKKIQPPSAEDVEVGIGFLLELIDLLENLKVIVLVGRAARKAHIRLSAKTSARILSCHHTSQRVVNVYSTAMQENKDVFTYLRATTG